MSSHGTALANTALRGFGLVARFALNLYLAKFLDLRTLGTYGLIYGVIAIAPALLGLGLNFSLNREIIGLSHLEAGTRLRDRLAVTVSMLILAVVISVLCSVFGLLPAVPLAGWVLAIAFLEVIAFDIHMGLISLRMSLFANTLQFIRTASWIYPFLALSYFFSSLRSFAAIIYFWFASLLITFATLFIGLRDWPWRQIHERRINVTFLVRQVRTSGLIYASDLGIIGSAFLDRFIVGYQLGMEATGVFIFYWSLSNAIQLLVNVGWIQTSLPRWVDHFKAGGRDGLWKVLRTDLHHVALFGAILALVVFATVSVALPYLGRPRLSNYPYLFPMMLIAAILRLGSDVANYGLYACGLDRQWAWSNLLGVLLSAVFTVAGLRSFGLQGVGVAMIATAATLLCVRLFYLLGTPMQSAVGVIVEEV
jgi:O-antigen/teichoic acid export membrane protein